MVRGPAKLKDVADLAGVSITTVSRVLNRARGVERIPAECVGRVEAAAKSLGYRSSYLARSFQTGTSDGIGVTLEQTGGYMPLHAFGAAYLAAVDSAIRSARFHQVTIGPTQDVSAVARGLAFLTEKRVDALVVPAFEISRAMLDALEALRAPIVIFGKGGSSTLPAVELDHGQGIRIAVAHLADLGHRQIAWVRPEESWAAADLRGAALYSEAQARGGSAEDIIVTCSPPQADAVTEIADARHAVAAALRARTKITALVCYNDLYALGAVRGAADAGLRVPRDVSVIGFDDVYGCVAVPPLTTVSHMINEMSEQGVQCLLEMLQNPQAWEQMRGRRIRVRPRLVIRESTAAPRGARD